MRRTVQQQLDYMFEQALKREDGCWISHMRPNGKGYFHVSAVGMLTKQSGYRFVYEQVHGKLKDGMQVRHKCNVRTCINPEHLIAGTAADNTEDMMRAGRNRNGRTAELVGYVKYIV